MVSLSSAPEVPTVRCGCNSFCCNLRIQKHCPTAVIQEKNRADTNTAGVLRDARSRLDNVKKCCLIAAQQELRATDGDQKRDTFYYSRDKRSHQFQTLPGDLGPL